MMRWHSPSDILSIVFLPSCPYLLGAWRCPLFLFSSLARSHPVAVGHVPATTSLCIAGWRCALCRWRKRCSVPSSFSGFSEAMLFPCRIISRFGAFSSPMTARSSVLFPVPFPPSSDELSSRDMGGDFSQ